MSLPICFSPFIRISICPGRVVSCLSRMRRQYAGIQHCRSAAVHFRRVPADGFEWCLPVRQAPRGSGAFARCGEVSRPSGCGLRPAPKPCLWSLPCGAGSPGAPLCCRAFRLRNNPCGQALRGSRSTNRGVIPAIPSCRHYLSTCLSINKIKANLINRPSWIYNVSMNGKRE